jgi:DNA polymerase-3 subunit epsilon
MKSTKPKKFAVIDVETTGGFASGHRVTEVGIVISDGQQILEEYHTLINPLRDIPHYITTLTGITNAMVANAPTFEAVAESIQAFMQDAVFVAHHVDFDYSFIRNEMNLAGVDFKAQKLCTVRYARSLLKDQPRFGLARLAQRFNIINDNPHRALSDAQTAAHILHRLIAIDGGDMLQKKISKLATEVKIPAGLPPEQFHDLPHAPGVYFFYGADGKPLYIGKAKDLKARVTTHFRQAETARTQAFMRNIVKIETHLTGSELLAFVKEDVEIRKYWPPHNSAQKRANISYHVITYADQNGAIRLGVKKARLASDAIQTFQSLRAAKAWLNEQVLTYELDPEFCGLASMLYDFKIPSVEEHNERFYKLKLELNENNGEFLVLEKGRNNTERGFVWVRNGAVTALGFAPRNSDFSNSDSLAEHAEHVYTSPTLEALVSSYLATNEHVEIVPILEKEING